MNFAKKACIIGVQFMIKGKNKQNYEPVRRKVFLARRNVIIPKKSTDDPLFNLDSTHIPPEYDPREVITELLWFFDFKQQRQVFDRVSMPTLCF
jgi:hypothetical protein